MGKKSNSLNVVKCFNVTEIEQRKRTFHLKYSSVNDRYIRVSNGKEVIQGWENGVYMEENIQRNKTESEAYLSRNCNTSAEESASISWKFDFGKYKMDLGALKTLSSTYRENASVTWKIHDGANTNRYIIPSGDEKPINLHKLTGASSLVLSAFLRGGEGKEAWRETRVFYQTRELLKEFPLEIWVRLRPGDDIEKWEKPKGKSFTLTKKERDKKEFHLKYSSASDKYIRDSNNGEVIDSWASGIYAEEDVFRKVEKDWKKAYLSRKDGQTPDDTAFIAWKFDFGGYLLESGSLRAWSTIHHKNASVLWKLQDSMNPHRYIIPSGAKETISLEEFKGSSSLVLSAFLCGGDGKEGVAWQHTQLFRQDFEQKDEFPFEIKLKFDPAVTIFDKVEEMSIAAMNNDMEYLQEVLDCVQKEYGISELSIIHTNSQGDTPLHVAFKFDSVDAAVCLMDTFPALLNMTNREDKLPMNYASSKMKSAIEARRKEDMVVNSHAAEPVNDRQEDKSVVTKAAVEKSSAEVKKSSVVRQHPKQINDSKLDSEKQKQKLKPGKPKVHTEQIEHQKAEKAKEKLKTVKLHMKKDKGDGSTKSKEKLEKVKASTEKRKFENTEGKGGASQTGVSKVERTKEQKTEVRKKVKLSVKVEKLVVKSKYIEVPKTAVDHSKQKGRESLEKPNKRDTEDGVSQKDKGKRLKFEQKTRPKKENISGTVSGSDKECTNTIVAGKGNKPNDEQPSNSVKDVKPKKWRKRKIVDDDELDEAELKKMREERIFKSGDMVAVNGEDLDDDTYWVGRIRRIEGDVVHIHWYDKDFKGRYKPQFLKANNKAYLDTITLDSIMEKIRLVKGKVALT
ncbi:uncharacterized protein LOC144437600 [Glandiceps talaboti]